jgi:hypothetical protein
MRGRCLFPSLGSSIATNSQPNAVAMGINSEDEKLLASENTHIIKSTKPDIFLPGQWVRADSLRVNMLIIF